MTGLGLGNMNEKPRLKVEGGRLLGTELRAFKHCEMVEILQPSAKERTINNLNKLMSFLPSSSLLVDHITRYARASRLEYNKKPASFIL